MKNKNFNNIQNFSYKSMNDKNGDKSYDNVLYEITKPTVSSNVIRDDNSFNVNEDSICKGQAKSKIL